MKHIGIKIRDIRESNKLSREWLAASAGLSFSTIVNIELGKSNPDTDSIQRIAEALAVSVSTLLGEQT